MAKKKTKKNFADNVIDYVGAIADFITGKQKLVSPLPEDEDLNQSSEAWQKQHNRNFDSQMAEKGMYRWSDDVYREGKEPTPAPAKSWQPEDGFELENRPELIEKQPTADPTTSVPASTQNFEEIARPIFEEEGIPLSVGLGQYGAEGRDRGLGANRNNFYNINAVDSDPNKAFSYDSPEEGIRAYAKLLKRRYKSALEKEDPAEMIREIEKLGYAGDPKTYAQRATAANPATGKKYARYSDFVMDTPEFRKYYEGKKRKKK